MRFKLLKLGWQYIGLTFLVTAAAFNTGNNSLYMVSALMLGLFLVSGLLSDYCLWNVEVERTEPGELYARQPGPVWVRLRNRNRLFGAYALTVNGHPFPPVPRGRSTEAALGVSFARRGSAALPVLWVESRFPFGFLARRRAFVPVGKALVYPAVHSLHRPDSRTAKTLGEEERASLQGELLEYRSLKYYQRGDDPRHITWKKSAQRGALVVIEFDRRSRGALELFLDTRTQDERRFEEDVERTAAAVFSLLRSGAQVSLTTPDVRLPGGAGEGQRRLLLTFLALVRPSP